MPLPHQAEILSPDVHLTRRTWQSDKHLVVCQMAAGSDTFLPASVLKLPILSKEAKEHGLASQQVRVPHPCAFPY